MSINYKEKGFMEKAPGLFTFVFIFSPKQNNFLTNISEKMSIKYTVLGFEPMKNDTRDIYL